MHDFKQVFQYGLQQQGTWSGVIKGVALGHVLHAFPLPTSIWSLMGPDDELQLICLQEPLCINSVQSAWPLPADKTLHIT